MYLVMRCKRTKGQSSLFHRDECPIMTGVSRESTPPHREVIRRGSMLVQHHDDRMQADQTRGRCWLPNGSACREDQDFCEHFSKVEALSYAILRNQACRVNGSRDESTTADRDAR